MRLWHLLHEALTKTTPAQPIVSSYSQPNSMLYPQGIDCNRTLYLIEFLSTIYNVIILESSMIFFMIHDYMTVTCDSVMRHVIDM